MKERRFSELYKWKFYIIIAIASLITIFFFPMIGSEAGLSLSLPNSRTGWAIYIFSKVAISAINVLIFHCFMCQGKEDAKQEETYVEASKIMGSYISEIYNPRSPRTWNIQQYGIKGVTIFITTALGAITLTQAIITYDWISVLTYSITIIGSIIFGILQRGAAYEYWTIEYYNYAKMVEKQHNKVMELVEKNHQTSLPKRKPSV